MFFVLAAVALAAGALMAKPQERDWSQMFLALNPSVSPDGKLFAFEWKDRVWLAPTAGGTRGFSGVVLTGRGVCSTATRGR